MKIKDIMNISKVTINGFADSLIEKTVYTIFAFFCLIPSSNAKEKVVAKTERASAVARLDTTYDGSNYVIREYNEEGELKGVTVDYHSLLGRVHYSRDSDELSVGYNVNKGYQKKLKKAVKKYFDKNYVLNENGASACWGMDYFFGNGVTRNQAKGVQLLKIASENRQEGVNDLLGFCCYHGIGTKQDISQAIYYWGEKGKMHNHNSGSRVEFKTCNHTENLSPDSAIAKRLTPKQNADSLLRYISTIDKKHGKFYHYNVVCIAPDFFGNDWADYSVFWKKTDPSTDKKRYLGYVVIDGFVTYIMGKSALKYFDYSEPTDSADFIHKYDLIFRGSDIQSIDDMPLYHCGAVGLLYQNNYYIIDEKHWSFAMNYLDFSTHQTEGVSLHYYQSMVWNYMWYYIPE